MYQYILLLKDFFMLNTRKVYPKFTKTVEKLVKNVALLLIKNEVLNKLNCKGLINTYSITKFQRKPIF